MSFVYEECELTLLPPRPIQHLHSLVPAPVATLNYTNLTRISLGRDSTFCQTVSETDVNEAGAGIRWMSWGDWRGIGRVLAPDISPDGTQVKVNVSGSPAYAEGLNGATQVSIAHRAATALFPPKPGEAFEYDDFQNFRSHFNFTGDAAPSFSPPLACPRCVLFGKCLAPPCL